MNIQLKKKYFFVIIIVAINFLALEIISFLIIKVIEPRYQNKFNLEQNSEKIKKELIGKKYSRKIPYLRDKNQYNGVSYVNVRDNKDYIFNSVNEFSSSNSFNILIQGDSFGESMNKQNIFPKFSKFFKKEKIGVINSAVSSYALIPHYFQLDMLLNKFDLKHDIQIIIYDQTDIGDDLYRYIMFLNNDHYKRYKFYDLELMNSFSKKKSLNIVKLFLLSKNYFLREKNRYLLSNFETCKKILRRTYLKSVKKLPLQLEPLIFGINSKERNKLIKLVSRYIDLSFSNNNLKNLYFVTHPHIKHVNKKYLIDNRDILFTAIKNHKFKDKIHVISFFEYDNEFYEFVDGDIFSHPTDIYYSKKFWPKIFDKVLK